MELRLEEDLSPARVWRVELDVGAEDEARLRRVLTGDELARAESFSRPAARQRYVVARGTLRRQLGDLLRQSPESVPIVDGPTGKPRLAGENPGLHFNLSHSGTLALIAIADREVGVDLEAIRPVPFALAIARRLFSPAEARFIEAGGEDEIDRRFLICWTRKEALVKAAGTGLGSAPSTRDWRIVVVPVGEEHVAALALREGPIAKDGVPFRGHG